MKYRKKPVVIDAVIFTRQMAEGSKTLPEGVTFMARTTYEGKFQEFANEPPLVNFETCHKHVVNTMELVRLLRQTNN